MSCEVDSPFHTIWDLRPCLLCQHTVPVPVSLPIPVSTLTFFRILLIETIGDDDAHFSLDVVVEMVKKEISSFGTRCPGRFV